ncbi:MAG: hypothetical protein D6782_11450, partial [Alphaproteobacteria bacterium]
MLAAIFAIFPLGALAAGEKRDHLGDFRDWSTFRDTHKDGTRVCYMISQPKESRADKADVKRGAIYAMVS